MRKQNNSTFPAIYGIRYGADTSGLTVENLPEFVRKRAYQLFEIRGRQPAHELDDWLQAEREIGSRFGILELSPEMFTNSLNLSHAGTLVRQCC